MISHSVIRSYQGNVPIALLLPKYEVLPSLTFMNPLSVQELPLLPIFLNKRSSWQNKADSRLINCRSFIISITPGLL